MFALSYRVSQQCECVEPAPPAGSVWRSVCPSSIPVDSGAEVLSPVSSGSCSAAAAR